MALCFATARSVSQRCWRQAFTQAASAGNVGALVAATARSADLDSEIHELNGQPALVLYDENAPFAAVLLGVVDGRVHRVFFHADAARLRYLGPRGGGLKIAR